MDKTEEKQEEEPSKSAKDKVQEVAAEEPFGRFILLLFYSAYYARIYTLNIIGTLLQELEFLLISHFTLKN